MGGERKISSWTRRQVLLATPPTLSFLLPLPKAYSYEDADEPGLLIQKQMGKIPVESERIQLTMPHVFPNGYTVPMSISVDCPMTENDYVKRIRVFAPQNPVIEVASFHFAAGLSVPRVSTRIRLAEPQNILAVAEMNDGSLLLAQAFVNVATNGCK